MDYYLLNTTVLGTTTFPAGSLVVGNADPVTQLQASGGILITTSSASAAVLQAIASAQQARTRGAAYQVLDSIVLGAFFSDSIFSLETSVAANTSAISGIDVRLAARMVSALVDVTDDPLNPVVVGGFGLSSVTHLATGHYRLNLGVTVDPTKQGPQVQLLGGLGATAECWGTQLVWTAPTTYELWMVKTTTAGGTVFANNDFYFRLEDISVQ